MRYRDDEWSHLEAPLPKVGQQLRAAAVRHILTVAHHGKQVLYVHTLAVPGGHLREVSEWRFDWVV